MSSKVILRSLLDYQRISTILQRLEFQILRRNYATSNVKKFDRAAFSINTYNFDIYNSCISRRKSTLQLVQEITPSKNKKIASDTSILKRVELYFQQHGFLNFDLFVRFLNQLESKKSSDADIKLNSEQIDFLLGACGTLMPSQGRQICMQLFRRFWRYLENTKKLRPQHFYIQLQVLKHNFISLSNFQTFLEFYSQLNGSIDSELYSDILEVYCGCGDMRGATEFLSYMRNQEIPLTERNFNDMLLGHGRNHDLNGCNNVLNNMIATGLTVSNNTQKMLIKAHLENDQIQSAVDILDKFHRQFNTAQAMDILESLLHMNAEPELVERLIAELPKEFFSNIDVPTPLKNLCVELLYNGKLTTALNLILTLPNPEENERQNSDVYGVFLLSELLRLQHHLNINNTLNKTNVDAKTIISYAHMLIESGKNKRALHVATEIAIRRNPSQALPYLKALAVVEPLRPHYFWPLLLRNFEERSEEGILQTLELMRDLSVSCNQETLAEYILPRLSIIIENPLQAVKTLEERGNIKPSQVLTLLIRHLLQQQKIDQVTQLTTTYPTKIQLSLLIKALSNATVKVRATKTYNRFTKALVQLLERSDDARHDYIGELLLNMLQTQNRLCTDLSAVQRFINEMQKFELKLSPSAIDGVLVILKQTNEVEDDVKIKSPAVERIEEIRKTLMRMMERNLVLTNSNSIDSSTGNQTQTTTSIKHPRDMNLEELECHLVELESKGLNTRGVLRRLLQLYVRENRLERAIEMKTRCDTLKVQISPGMLASIFDLNIKLKDIELAEQTLKHLLHAYPGFRVDEHKIIDFAALMVHTGNYEKAKKFLEEYARTHKISGGDYVTKNIWNFLTNTSIYAAATNLSLAKEQNLTRDTFHFLKNLNFCRTPNALLGPIVREYLLRGDLHEAIAEFKRLADKYKHTPLQYELLSLLVRLGNDNVNEHEMYNVDTNEAQQLLSDATQTVISVHGLINMNSALLLAFAESGTDTQLRRLIMNPEFRINQEYLIKNCEHLSQEGAIQTLLRLARCARGLSHVINEQSVYDMLLASYAKENNYKAALSLYDRLESDDELKISQQFLRNLINLLKINKLEIPPEMSLRAHVL